MGIQVRILRLYCMCLEGKHDLMRFGDHCESEIPEEPESMVGLDMHEAMRTEGVTCGLRPIASCMLE